MKTLRKQFALVADVVDGKVQVRRSEDSASKQRGAVIVRYSDGTTRKVLLK